MFRSLAVLTMVAGCAPRQLEVHTFVSGAEGFDTATYWVDSGESVVVFDAQFTPALAAQMLAEIQAQTESPVSHVVVTHPNPDKFNGATVFQQAGAQLVMSRDTASALPGAHAYKEAHFVGVGAFAADAYPALPVPDLVFDDELTLDLGRGVIVRLWTLSHPGVASTQSVARVGDDVFVGDLVAGGVHAWLEGGIVDGVATPDIAGWVAALGELQQTIGDEVRVHPGRGMAGPASTVLPAQQGYLAAMDEVVADYVALRSPEALAADADAHWAALTTAAEAAFPDHGLSYLVTYGVYGLAFQHASR